MNCRLSCEGLRSSMAPHTQYVKNHPTVYEKSHQVSLQISTPMANFLSGGLASFVYWIMAIPADNIKKQVFFASPVYVTTDRPTQPHDGHITYPRPPVVLADRTTDSRRGRVPRIFSRSWPHVTSRVSCKRVGVVGLRRSHEAARGGEGRPRRMFDGSSRQS